MQATTAALYVSAGHLMVSMSSQEVKTILFRYGQLPSQLLLLAVKATNHGLQLYASINGGVMIGTIDSAV